MTDGERGSTVAMVAGIGLHALLLPLFLTSGLVAPPWAVLGLCAMWAALLAVAVLRRHRPFVVLAVPAVAFALWIATISAGGAWLDWSA